MNLTERIRHRALELGFDLVDVAPALELPHADRLRRWLEQGMHGDMAWMARNLDKRIDPSRLVEGARSVVAVGMLYAHPDDGPIARYARGLDYHDEMRRMLRDLEAFVRNEVGGEPPVRSFVDTAPMLERDVAVLAGLGWLGRSACVINQQLGSYLLLGELCVGVELEPASAPHPFRCGTCSRCIDACPTQAIVEPHVVDARRCISYLTIELRGPIPRELRRGVGDHLFGCDICQSVCPWNRRAPVTTHEAFAPLVEVQNLSLVELLELGEDEFRARFRRSPLWRPRRHGIARNAAVVLGNLGNRDAVPALADAMLTDPHPLVRGHAAWALGELGGDAARQALEHARRIEVDAGGRDEIEQALRGLH